MASSPSDVYSGEKEPEDKPEVMQETEEDILKFYCDAFHNYFVEHLDVKDMLLYKYFGEYIPSVTILNKHS